MLRLNSAPNHPSPVVFHSPPRPPLLRSIGGWRRVVSLLVLPKSLPALYGARSVGFMPSMRMQGDKEVQLTKKNVIAP